MKRMRNKILAASLTVVMTAACIGCAEKETGTPPKEDGGQTEDTQTVGTDGTLESGLGEMENDLPENAEFPDPILFNEECAAYEAWAKREIQVGALGGILFDGEDLLVCDMGNHCVVRLTTEGEFVESYGELGSEAGNFVTPTAIVLHENEIYVLDSGNMRIQVFDKDMNYVREILFEGRALSLEATYNDMAIAGDGTIYIVTNASYKEETGLFYIEEGLLRIVSSDFSGYLAEWDGVVYAADKWRFVMRGSAYGYHPAENWLYQVEKTGLQKICELPYMYAPVDFIVKDDGLYTVSTVWGQMNRTSMDGELLEAFVTIEEVQSHDMYLCMQDENTFYVADTRGYLYKVFRTEGEE